MLKKIKSKSIEKRYGAKNKRTGKRKHIGYTVRIRFAENVPDERLVVDGAKSKGKAEEILKRLLDKYEKGISNYSLRECLNDYLSSKKVQQASDNSKRIWRDAVKNLSLLDEVDLDIHSFNRMAITSYLSKLRSHLIDNLGRTRRHLQGELEVLNASLNYFGETRDENFLNPITRTIRESFGLSSRDKRARKVRLAKALSEEEIQSVLDRFVDLSDPIYYCLVFAHLSYGMRVGELLGLEWEDINFEKRELSLRGQLKCRDSSNNYLKYPVKAYSTKGREGRGGEPYAIWKLSDQMIDVLSHIKSLKRESNFIFVNRLGRVVGQDQYSHWLKQTGFFNEEGMTTHKIRKTSNTFGKILSNNPSNWHLSLMRHGDENINSVYTDPIEESRNNPIPLLMGDMLSKHSKYPYAKKMAG